MNNGKELTAAVPLRIQIRGFPAATSVIKLSVVMPVYNEAGTIREILHRVRGARAYLGADLEVVLVDDFSTDGTRDILKTEETVDGTRILYHDRNRGKGAAIRTAIPAVTGDIVLIQDADLEYDPLDYPRLIRPVMEGRAKVVYGSRFLGRPRSMSAVHRAGNRLLTLVTNALYGSYLTDMETCYKVFAADVIRGLHWKSDRFDFEPEVTARILKRGYRIAEVPISYNGRAHLDGKKITWRDGFAAIYRLVWYRFGD